jgi:hypothetical protein
LDAIHAACSAIARSGRFAAVVATYDRWAALIGAAIGGEADGLAGPKENALARQLLMVHLWDQAYVTNPVSGRPHHAGST